MPDLDFQVIGAEPVPYAVSPLMHIRLRITDAEANFPVRNVILQCQIRLEVSRRRYSATEQASLVELFGEPERWGETLKGMLWTHASVVVPPFEGGTEVNLPVQCTYDLNVAATKYFVGLESDEVPISLLFSGTIFYEADDGALQISQVPWEKEANYRLPVRVWREMMDVYYPNSAWLNLRRDVFEKLRAFKTARGLTTWEQTFELLLRDRSVDPAKAEAGAATWSDRELWI
jgi:hypothetical protein